MDVPSMLENHGVPHLPWPAKTIAVASLLVILGCNAEPERAYREQQEPAVNELQAMAACADAVAGTNLLCE